MLRGSRNYRVLRRSGLAFIALILAFGSFLVTDAGAEEKPSPAPYQFEPIPREAEKMTVRRLLSEVLRLRFNGYVQGSYQQNFNNPSNGINQLRIFDVDSNQFRPNVIQLVLERPAKTDGSALDQLGFRVKFNAGANSDYIGGVNLGTWADFQEFYVQYIAPIGHGLDLQVGQFNSLVGYEQVGNPYSPNYSRSYLYFGQPFTTGGISATYEFTKQVSFSIRAIPYINAVQANTQHDPLVEYLLMVFPSDKVRLMLYGLVGPRVGAPGTPGGTIVLTGGYASWQLASQTWAVVEAYYANQANSSTISSGKNARWDGVAAYLFHDFTSKWGIRLRGEIFEDAGGLVTCQGTTDRPKANVCFGATSAAPAPAIAQTLWEFTATLEFRPLPSMRTRLEYRYDKSNQNVFQLGDRATSYQPTLSLDFIYLF